MSGTASDPNDKLTAKLGEGDRFIDRVDRGWEEGNSRIEAWFVENRLICESDPLRWLGVVLQYVTALLDNMGHWNRFWQIWSAADIEGKYLPHLREFSGQLNKGALTYAKVVAAVVDPNTLDAFTLALKTRLDSRLLHWKAEGLRYVREQEVAQAIESTARQQTATNISQAPAEAPLGRKPDFETSRTRIKLVCQLARELAKLKSDLSGYCTVEGLKETHRDFILWQYIDAARVQELVDGEPYTPKAFAERLVLEHYGLTSRETLKKDRKKLRKVTISGK